MVWPFKKRQKKDAGGERRTWSEKAQPQQPAGATVLPSTPPTSSSSVQRRTSNGGRPRQRSNRGAPNEKGTEAQPAETLKKPASPGKESMPRACGSIEDITALPVGRRLDCSPHLRPIDLGRPPIPYNFRPHSTSQTSIQPPEAKPSRSQTLRSRRSGYDSGSPARRRSGKRRKDEHLREEEIRAMTAPIPIPKRPGEGPLRRDSKKLRSLSGARDSTISLPPQGSIHSSMSGIMEQRGWEVGSFDVFSARPHVRLSGTPTYTYISPSSILSASHIPRDQPVREKKLKRPETRDSAKKRQTIGHEADDYDASDLRMLLERDAKRRERRKKEEQEKLDRKLRSWAARNRGDSDLKRRDGEETHAEEHREREVLTPPTDVHPALRDQPTVTEADIVGLGIGASGDIERSKSEQTITPHDPFADSVPSPQPTESELERELHMPGAFSPVQTPLEDPTIHTAQAVRISQTYTPPLSPVRAGQMERMPSGLAQSTSASELPDPTPVAVPERKISESRERRPGAWASLFRRGGTNLRKDGKASASQGSFSNTSRESMRNHPLPTHLVDTQTMPLRRTSGTPVRTQSKFREDLPEMPISPPDSRMPSPDVTVAAAAAAAARRGRHSPVPMDIPGAGNRDFDPDLSMQGRNDTPISPSIRGHGLMSASLASVDSEGSWLASSTKRQSGQSALSRGMGSLSRRNQEFVGSYEELGGDRDAEYVARRASSPGLIGHGISNSALVGLSPYEGSDYGERPAAVAPGEPVPVHGSVRRQPTLVRRDPRVKSREGLLTEISAELEDAEDSPISATGKSDLDEISDPSESQLRSARSVNYGKGHARQMSAGSARLMDIKRPSIDASRGGGDLALKRASRTSQP